MDVSLIVEEEYEPLTFRTVLQHPLHECGQRVSRVAFEGGCGGAGWIRARLGSLYGSTPVGTGIVEVYEAKLLFFQVEP